MHKNHPTKSPFLVGEKILAHGRQGKIVRSINAGYTDWFMLIEFADKSRELWHSDLIKEVPKIPLVLIHSRD